MTRSKGTILLVEDDDPQRTTLAGFLRKRGYEVVEAASAADALAQAVVPDLLLTDLRLGGPDGVALLTSLRERHADLQAIVLTAYGTVKDAVRAMRAGAYDFLAKPIDLVWLEALVEKALERVRLAGENRGLRQMVHAAGALADLVGESRALCRAKELALKVAASSASVLIQGESGTGKELLARGIHLASSRRNKPFVAVNCAALPQGLIESELFGHERGSFTGAIGTHKGRFERADGGTLLLDEVGDIPLPIQVKLLRAIQSGEFQRVGGDHTLRTDVRILAATHRDLEEGIRAGTFREDLFWRLNVVSIPLPPLRERTDDIPFLVDHFLRKHADLAGREPPSIAPEVVARLMRWPFPGNVRELENWVERAMALAEGDALGPADFPPQLFDEVMAPSTAATEDAGLEAQVASLETGLLRRALEHHGGNKSAAARELKLTERAMRYKMRKYGLR